MEYYISAEYIMEILKIRTTLLMCNHWIIALKELFCKLMYVKGRFEIFNSGAGYQILNISPNM